MQGFRKSLRGFPVKSKNSLGTYENQAKNNDNAGFRKYLRGLPVKCEQNILETYERVANKKPFFVFELFARSSAVWKDILGGLRVGILGPLGGIWGMFGGGKV